MSSNPYDPTTPAGLPPASAATVGGRVMAPAIGLLTSAILGMMCALYLLANGLMILTGAHPAMEMQIEGMEHLEGVDPNQMATMFRAGGVFWVVVSVVWIMLGILIIVGAWKMKNLHSYGLAVTATILAMIPCTAPCCVVGIPIGIWALIVLRDAEVRSAFH